MTDTDLWGQDIALDASATGIGQPLILATGVPDLTDGVQTGVQDIRLRLFTRLGSLFYDQTFGSLVHDWVLEENTQANRLGLEAELVLRVEEDPRVQPGSCAARVLAWDERQVTSEVSWRFIGEDQPLNLVLQHAKSTKDMVIADVDPAQLAFSAGGEGS